MLKHFFFAIPAHGHVNPTLPLVRALVERGDRVVYYSIEPFRAALEAAGAEMRPIPFDFSAHRRLEHPTLVDLALTSARCVLAWMPALLDEARRERPDTVVFDAMCLWGRLLARLLEGTPSVCTFWGFVITRRLIGSPLLLRLLLLRTPTALARWWGFRRLAREIASIWSVPAPGLLDGLLAARGDLNLVFTSRELQPHPEDLDASFAFLGPGAGARPETGWQPPHPGRPLIYVSLGTVYSSNPELYRRCFEAFGNGPWSVLVALGEKTPRTALGEAPSNFVLEPSVPQLEVLQHAALFLTHGGMNSTTEGLLHRVPLVIVPQAGDQFLVARHLEKLGVALRLSNRTATPERLRWAAEQALMDQEVAHRIGALSDSLRRVDGPARGGELISELAVRRGIGGDDRIRTGE